MYSYSAPPRTDHGRSWIGEKRRDDSCRYQDTWNPSACSSSLLSQISTTDYGTGHLHLAVATDECNQGGSEHSKACHYRDSTRTRSTGSISSIASDGSTSWPRQSRTNRLVLLVSVVFCSYLGFYAVFVLMSHHNHADGVFGGGEPSLLRINALVQFLFGNLGSIILGRPSPPPQPFATNRPPVPRSILLILHAETVPGNDAVMLDHDRPLTAIGMQQAEKLGSYLVQHNIAPPDWIFCSPSVRTSYTLELIKHRWAPHVPVAFENILYVLAFNDYFAFVAGLNPNFKRVLIVGHNPAILNTAKRLMQLQGIEDFPDAGFLEITWTDQELWHTIIPGTGDVDTAVCPNSATSSNGFFDAMTTSSNGRLQ